MGRLGRETRTKKQLEAPGKTRAHVPAPKGQREFSPQEAYLSRHAAFSVAWRGEKRGRTTAESGRVGGVVQASMSATLSRKLPYLSALHCSRYSLWFSILTAIGAGPEP